MSISEYPPLVQWIKGLSMFTQKAWSATWKTASIKRRKQGQREGPKHDSSTKASFNYNSCNCVQELVSVHQLSGYNLWLALSPLITTIDFVVEIETKKRPINNPLVFSSTVLSFATCFVALIQVEIELHARRKMFQVLTQKREESIHSRGIVNDKSIASALCSDTGKGECFGLVVRFSQA